VGVGTTFTVDLPVSDEGLTIGTPVESIESRLPDCSHLRVLIVEDEPGIREVLRLELDAAKVRVIEEAEDGRIGLATALAMKPDIIFTDLKMPQMDGVELVQALRAPDSGMHPMIFVVTGGVATAYDKVTRDSLSRLVDGYVLKPFSSAQIRACLSLAVAKLAKKSN
jgi:two-component system response regulator YesN